MYDVKHTIPLQQCKGIFFGASIFGSLISYSAGCSLQVRHRPCQAEAQLVEALTGLSASIPQPFSYVSLLSYKTIKKTKNTFLKINKAFINE